MAQLSDRMRALVQPHLASIEPYDPAFTPTRINLSANENTYPLPPTVRTAIDDALSATPLNRYPDPMSNRLRDLIAARGGHSRQQICVGNGGDELLFNFLMAFGGPGRTLLNCPPAFSEYEFFASVNQTQVERVWRDSVTFELDMPRTLEAASHANMVILTSPNNPTGNLVSAQEVEQVCEACPGMVMVDEAYIEFADLGSSVEALLPNHPNLVVLHTLSKAFGEAGVRCGYVVAAHDVIDVFAAVRQIYSVNVLTQAAAEVAMRLDVMFEPIVQQIRSERERMFAALQTLIEGLGAASGELAPAVWPSQGNFLLLRVPGAADVRTRLRDEYSILARDFSAAPGLAGCLRITVGTPQENDEVLRALSQLLKEERS
ncbi:histidinol-phosphate transaminase [Collinsella sp. An2]|uniref:histidinol-phosphate transaminase n=1 Tax=Collinsella sp. An2 TaxID=1965585 RepID=UPI000B3AA0DC|nr:histidinol-phosphate transaminase [Collinsella sp. An2]OUP06408.1 histidinol-phosphate transaminase [Collinsella sp. An2]